MFARELETLPGPPSRVACRIREPGMPSRPGAHGPCIWDNGGRYQGLGSALLKARYAVTPALQRRSGRRTAGVCRPTCGPAPWIDWPATRTNSGGPCAPLGAPFFPIFWPEAVPVCSAASGKCPRWPGSCSAQAQIQSEQEIDLGRFRVDRAVGSARRLAISECGVLKKRGTPRLRNHASTCHLERTGFGGALGAVAG